MHAVLYTHEHADHIFGLDDLRIMQFYLGGPVPLYCEPRVEQRIRKSFDYAFQSSEIACTLAPFRSWPFTRSAWSRSRCSARRSCRCGLNTARTRRCWAFASATWPTAPTRSGFPPESMELLGGLDVLVLDCLRRKPHATHFGLEQALAIVERLRPRRTLFTHMSHELEHDATNAELPAGVELAYDGLEVPLT